MRLEQLLQLAETLDDKDALRLLRILTARLYTSKMLEQEDEEPVIYVELEEPVFAA